MSTTSELRDADVHRKGLRKDAVGLFGSTTIGLASTAPAFSLAATIAFLVLDRRHAGSRRHAVGLHPDAVHGVRLPRVEPGHPRLRDHVHLGDEGFGRIGDYFAMNRFGVTPDIITCAKGMTSGYAPLGAMIAHDRLFEPFRHGANTFLHGYTWGGHPVAAAVALANLDLFEAEGVLAHVRENEDRFRATLERLHELPIVGDVRGAGYFYGIELVKDKATKQTFDADESERLLRGFLSGALFEAGLYCRADDRGDPVIQLAPPLIIGQPEFDEIESILRQVLTEGWSVL